MTKIRTRYAPSPTGKMHVGNLRTALYAYLIAKHEYGDFILRIEDTDRQRFVEGAVDIINRTLEMSGLIHDEGPDKDGGCGPYVQSERCEEGIYLEYAKKLVDKGDAYYCFCDEDRLNSLRTNINGEKDIVIYDKHCLSLSKEEVEERLKRGDSYVIRQNIPNEGKTVFHDELYGAIEVDNSELDDMILIKSDGYPTYNFANVVDDHLMGITHVVRGNEYLSSAPKYTRLYEAFGWKEPVYIHCPLITDVEHKKLSKRSGHSSFEDLVEQGFLPEAIVNFVALLGWSPSENKEIFTMEELIKEFDYHRVSKSPAVFDIIKLRWMNGVYISNMSDDDFINKVGNVLKKYVDSDEKVRTLTGMIKTRIESFNDIENLLDFLKKLPDYDIELFKHKKMKTDEEISLKVLEIVLPKLNILDDYSNSNVYDLLVSIAKDNELKNGQVLWPVRVALSGLPSTPGGASELAYLLGKNECIKRIEFAIDKLRR